MLYPWQATVQDDAGNVIVNPQVTVWEADGVTLAAIFDEAGAALPNPLTGGLDGFVQFWADAGEYRIEGSKGGGETQVWAWVAGADLSVIESDINVIEAYAGIYTATEVGSVAIPFAAQSILTSGYYASGDGGSASYKRVSAEPSHPGKLQSADGSWWEMTNRLVSGLEFGLVVGASSAADDNSNVIISALDYLNARGGGTLEFPNGQIYHSGVTYTEARAINFRGAANSGFWNSNKGTLLTHVGSGDCFVFIDPAGLQVSNLAFSYSSTPTSGYVLTMRATGGAAIYNKISDLYINDHWNGILVAAGHIEINGLGIYRGKGSHGIRVAKPVEMSAIDLIKINGLILDTQVSGGSTNYDGISVGDCATLWINDSTCLQCRYGYDIGLDAKFVRINKSDAENCSSNGFIITDANKVWMTDCYSNLNWGSGVVVSNAFTDSIWISGCTIGLNGNDGVFLDNVNGGNVSIVNCLINDNSNNDRGGVLGSSHGVNVSGGVSGYRVQNCRLGGGADGSGVGRQGFGWRHAAGAGDRFMVQGNDATGNQSGGYSDDSSGSMKSIVNNLG